MVSERSAFRCQILDLAVAQVGAPCRQFCRCRTSHRHGMFPQTPPGEGAVRRWHLPPSSRSFFWGKRGGGTEDLDPAPTTDGRTDGLTD